MIERVKMTELAVELALIDCDPSEHIIYLVGPAQSVEQYLQGQRQFLPMSSEGVPKIVNREQIIWLRIPPAEPDLEITAVRTETIVELTDGTRLEGYVRLEGTYVRLSDTLNDPSAAFLRMDESSGTFYINKSRIRCAIPR
jgi:hypothetical protein